MSLILIGLSSQIQRYNWLGIFHIVNLRLNDVYVIFVQRWISHIDKANNPKM